MTQKQKEIDYSIPISGTSCKHLSAFIDSLLVSKRLFGEPDYSESIARILIAKACVDERVVYNAIVSEILIAANIHSVKMHDSEFIAMDDLVGILDDLINPANEMIDERVDQLESEMSWTETSKFKELCGE